MSSQTGGCCCGGHGKHPDLNARPEDVGSAKSNTEASVSETSKPAEAGKGKAGIAAGEPGSLSPRRGSHCG